MAHLDLDTANLIAVAARAHDAAGALGAAGHARPADAAHAAGHPVLADAIDALRTTWSPTHHALVAALESVAGGLGRAAATFDAAETANARDLAHAITGVDRAPDAARRAGTGGAP